MITCLIFNGVKLDGTRELCLSSYGDNDVVVLSGEEPGGWAGYAVVNKVMKLRGCRNCSRNLCKFASS